VYFRVVVARQGQLVTREGDFEAGYTEIRFIAICLSDSQRDHSDFQSLIK